MVPSLGGFTTQENYRMAVSNDDNYDEDQMYCDGCGCQLEEGRSGHCDGCMDTTGVRNEFNDPINPDEYECDSCDQPFHSDLLIETDQGTYCKKCLPKAG